MIRIHVEVDTVGNTFVRKTVGTHQIHSDQAEIAQELIRRLRTTKKQLDVDLIGEEAKIHGIDLRVEMAPA